ncbi:MAG: DUF3048 domain-containing protein [Beutenbergiaceae bacterium]
MQRRVGALLGAVAVIGLVVGCSSGGKETGSIDVADAVDKGAVPDPVPGVVWPLTGLPMGEAAARPALSIKIENSADSRPQTGLEEADVVWEEMVEGGITRFNAVFHSSIPEQVGPIRSLRPMDAAISAPFGGIFVASGGQVRFYNQIAETGLTMLTHDGGADGFYRDSDRFAPHNLFGDPQVFLESGGDQPPAPQFLFGDRPADATALSGTSAERIVLSFPSATPGWTWNGESYLRDEAGTVAETTDGGQIAAVNVIVLRVDVRYTSAEGGSSVPETLLTGTGDAVVAAGGSYVEATWSKPETDSVLTLTLADGSPVLLAPGNTWVELLPHRSSFEIS